MSDPVASSSKSNTPVNHNNLHEMDTQIPYPTASESSDTICCADTQLPMENDSPSFHSLNTQLPVPDHMLNELKITDKCHIELDCFGTNKEYENSLYNAETQIPIEYENGNTLNKANITDSKGAETQLPNLENRNLPNECKQNDHDVFTAATQLPDSENATIFTVPTQLPTFDNGETQLPTIVNQSMTGELREKTKDDFGEGDKSNDHILFDEVDSQSFLEVFDSQSLLSQKDSPEDENVIIPLSQASKEDEDDVIKTIASKRANRIESDSTDCDDLDVLQTKKIPGRPTEDDLTDCEDDIDIERNKLKGPQPKTTNFEDIATQCVVENVSHKSPILHFGDMATQVTEDYIELNNGTTPKSVPITSDETSARKNVVQNFDDMATQVIGDDMEIKNHNKLNVADKTPKETIFENMVTQVIPENEEIGFEDLATQVIQEIPPEKFDCSNTANNQYSEEIIHSFKVPYSTPLKPKKKDTPKSVENKFLNPNIPLPKSPIKIVNLANDEQYYAATQELYDDLCSQKASSPEFVRPQATKTINNSLLKEKQIEIINLDAEIVPSSVESYEIADRFQHKEISPKKIFVAADKSSEISDGDETINKFVSSLSTKMIREVIGVDKEVANITRVPSDLSDVEVTPKKVRPFKFIETELPSSQEIKTSISTTYKTVAPESSSDSEPERNSTPIVFRKKKLFKQAKVDLMKNIKESTLPTRVITRVRKPTSKIQNSDEDTKRLSKKILKLNMLPDFTEVNKETISENSLKTKTENIKDSTTNLTAEVKKKSKARKNVTANKKIDDWLQRDIGDKQENENLTNKLKVKNITVKKTDDYNSKTINKENNESVPTEEKSRNSRSTRRTKEIEKTEINVSMEKYSKGRSRHKVTENTERNVRSTSNEKNEDIVLLPETRSTRRKPEADKITKNQDDSTKGLISKRLRPRKIDNKGHEIDTTTEKSDISKPPDIRRSKRQRTVKVIETKQNYRNSKSKSSQDQSTVYNISSESSVESPRPLKRSARDNDAPSPKRTRSAISSNTCTIVNSNTSFIISSNRSVLGCTETRGVKTHYVLFTAFPCGEVKSKLETLGKFYV